MRAPSGASQSPRLNRAIPSQRALPSQRSFNSARPANALADIGDRFRSRGDSGSSRGSDTPILDALLGNRGGDRSDRLGAIGDILRNNRRGDYYDDHDDDFADAYLAVGLANAAVGLVSVLAENNRNAAPYPAASPHSYAHTCPYCVAAPAQQQAVRERILISPARYEKYDVWIPARFDPNTGQQLGGGFYETRTRLIPEEYEYREIAYGH